MEQITNNLKNVYINSATSEKRLDKHTINPLKKPEPTPEIPPVKAEKPVQVSVAVPQPGGNLQVKILNRNDSGVGDSVTSLTSFSRRGSVDHGMTHLVSGSLDSKIRSHSDSEHMEVIVDLPAVNCMATKSRVLAVSPVVETTNVDDSDPASYTKKPVFYSHPGRYRLDPLVLVNLPKYSSGQRRLEFHILEFKKFVASLDLQDENILKHLFFFSILQVDLLKNICQENGWGIFQHYNLDTAMYVINQRYAARMAELNFYSVMSEMNLNLISAQPPMFYYGYWIEFEGTFY